MTLSHRRGIKGHATLLLAALSAATATAAARANVSLAAVLGDHMILQRDLPVPIWGRADPGEAIAVTLSSTDGVIAEAAGAADEQGRWLVRLPPLHAGGPYVLTVTGHDTVRREDVLVGEVWLCSGQSNMEWALRDALDGERSAADAHDPELRLLRVPRVAAAQPQDDLLAAWQACTPETAADFSAVAYFFGSELRERLHVPVGLVAAAWGGTFIEPWTPPEGFRSVPALHGILEQMDAAERQYAEALAPRLDDLQLWAVAADAALSDDSPVPPMPECPRHPLESEKQPAGLWNGMLHPLVPFALRGALWYQGEQNIGEGLAYHDKMQGLIQGWRQAWGQGDFPFYFVQLAPFRYPHGPQALPELREAQRASLTLPHTGMVVTTDVGALDDIHPPDKRTVGHRLALLARARTYGETSLVDSGPMFAAVSADGAGLRVRFDSVGGGLQTRDGLPPDGFELAGSDGVFRPASAVIDADGVLLSSAEVPSPHAVRFGFHQESSPNLVNREELPAAPFRASVSPP